MEQQDAIDRFIGRDRSIAKSEQVIGECFTDTDLILCIMEA